MLLLLLSNAGGAKTPTEAAVAPDVPHRNTAKPYTTVLLLLLLLQRLAAGGARMSR
jgi:hypothetical protein